MNRKNNKKATPSSNKESSYKFQTAEESKNKFYLFPEWSRFIKFKMHFMLVITIHSCFIYPVELSEILLQDIKNNNTDDLVVNCFDFEKGIEIFFNFWFFYFTSAYDLFQIQLFICECLFLADMLLKFFVIKTEDQQQYAKPIDSWVFTSRSYLKNGFKFDFIMLFPWALLFSKILGTNLNIINIIKLLRLAIIDDYLNNRNLKSFCSKIFDYWFQAILDDPVKSIDYKENRTMIEKRLLVNNLVIALKIILYTILFVHFIGSYWLCFSLYFFQWNNYQDIDNYFVGS